jgi:gluconokinase
MGQRRIDSWFLGIDLGTGSCKTVVIDDMAQVLGRGSAEYPGNSAHEKWLEQEPEGVLSGMVTSVRRALENAGDLPGNCAGLSIGGALHSVMAVDSTGAPLSGIITWADSRGFQQSKDIKQSPAADAVYQQTGCPVHGLYPLYKIRWLKEKQSQIFDQTARFLSAKEYVVHRLIHQYVVDYSVASGSGLLNTHNLTWNPLSLELAHIKPEQLSDVIDPKVIFAGLDPELSRQMGIAPSTRLILGSSDAANSSLGAGAVSPHQATCMIGTSGALRIITPQPLLDRQGRSWCYAIDHEHWLVGGALNNGGVALAWLRDALNGVFSGNESGRLSFEDLLHVAEGAPPGAGGLICLPFFTGERSPNWNSNARAAFFGLSLEHGIAHLARALLEGVAYRLRSIYDVLVEVGTASGVEIQELRAVGGFTRSPLWMTIVASALERALSILSTGESSSLAAAYWAMLGTGRLARLEDIAGWAVITDIQPPDPLMVGVYRQLYPLYLALYENLAGSFERIADFQRG